MPIVPAFTAYVPFETITAAALNAKLNALRDTINTYAVLTDVSRTITVANTWSALQTHSAGLTVSAGTTALKATTVDGLLTTKASATGSAGLNIPHGTAPTSPVNGDVWTTTGGAFVRINAATQSMMSGTGTSGKITRFTGAATLADSSLADDGTFVSSATQPRATGHGAPGTSVGTSSSEDVILATELLDVGGMFTAGGDRFTVPANGGGTYRLMATCVLTSASGTTALLQWRLNDTTILASSGAPLVTLAATVPQQVTICFDVNLAAADFVNLYVTNTGVTNALTIGRTIASVARTW